MSVALRPYTYADLEAMPDDGRRYEIIGGELLEVPSPGRGHQDILGYLHVLFRQFVVTRDLGKVYMAPLDVRLSTYDIVQPDLLYIGREHLRGQSDRAIDGAPDLVLEVLSPTTRSVDLVRKFATYATAGVREYWIIDPTQRAITVYTYNAGQYEPIEASEGIARSVALPGLEIVVAEVFAAVE